MSSFRASFRRLVSAALLASACFALPAPSSAQFGGQAGFADAFQPDFLARDVSLFVEALGLEEWQRPIVETLLSDYQVSFASGVEGVRQRMSGMKDQLNSSDPNEVMRKVMAPIDAWSTEKIRLRDEFIENVRSQLSDMQLERWPRFERAFRREKSLDRGELQGESVNLLLILRELQLDPRVQAELAQTVDEFELRLDGALVNRQRVIESQQAKVKDAMSSGNQEAGLAAMETIMGARVAVRQTQDDGRVALRQALESVAGQVEAAQFEELALRRAYPKVYRPDPILPLFQNAREIATITVDQVAALNALEANYSVEIAGVNRTMADAYRSEEPKEPRRRVALQLARQEGADAVAKLRSESDPVSNIRKTREETYERYRNAIMAILDESQQREMPIYSKATERVPVDEMERAKQGRESQPGSGLGAGGAEAGQRRHMPRDKSEPERDRHLGANPNRGPGASDRASPPSRVD